MHDMIYSTTSLHCQHLFPNKVAQSAISVLSPTYLHRQVLFPKKVAPSVCFCLESCAVRIFFTDWILHRQDFLLHKVAPSGVEAGAVFFLIGAAKKTFMSVHLCWKKNLTACLRWKIKMWQCINLGGYSRWCIFCEENPDGASLLEN